MLKKEIDLSRLINDPFKGKGGYMPEKITKRVKVRVGLNENLAFPEDFIRGLLQKAATTIDPRIYPEDYCESLCEIIAQNTKLDASNIVIGNGGDRIIDLMVRLTLKSNYNAVIIYPTYSMYEHAIKVQGGNITEFFLTPAPFFDLDVDAILTGINQKKDRLLFLCSPNNPTGNQFTEEKLHKLLIEFPGIVALDETYSDFANYSLAAILKHYPNLIIMKSLSKLYGMAGMRVGYALADEFLIKRIKEILPAFNVNSVSLELAKLVIQEKEVLSQLVTNIITERDIVFKELQKIPNINPFQSCTNFILFKINNYNATLVQKRLLSEFGVLVRNMSEMPLCKNCLRVTITTKANNTEFINALKETMETI